MPKFINKKTLACLVSGMFFVIIFLPGLASAELVTCDGSTSSPCNINAFVGMINGIITWIISLAGVIFTISAIWGGFLYMTSGENPGNKSKAKSILLSTLVGFVIILTAWLIVVTILNYLVPSNSTIFRFLR